MSTRNIRPRAGLQSRSRVPSRARLGCFSRLGPSVGRPHWTVVVQAAHCLHRALSPRELAPVVGAALGVVAELDDRHDVQDPVDAPVPGPGQPVALLITAGRVDGCGAVPGGEMVTAGEAADIADVAQQPGGAGRADPVELLQRAAGGLDQFGELLVRSFDLLVDDGDLRDELRGQLPAGAADDVAGPDRVEQREDIP
jgi:hypothetical protein